MMSKYRDLQTFQAYAQTLDIEYIEKESGQTLIGDYRTPTVALHTLPRLQVAGEDGPEDTPELRLLGLLGEGGMGQVHLASQIPLDREVAVKTAQADLGEATARALLQEACVTGYLEHPNIIPVYMVGRTSDGAPLIVMKRVDGDSWLEKLVADADCWPPENLDEHIKILIQVCNAVRFAHSRGILHRDIKPANIMLGHFDEVYLLDWGMAVSMVEDKPLLPPRRLAKTVAGTPHYMAPEMTLETDPEVIDELTDVFLLGATLHHILTGRPRHGGTSMITVLFAAHLCAPYEYADEVPLELAQIAQKACHKDKDQRFQSAEALRDALEDFLQHRESIALSTLAEQKRVELQGLLESTSPDASAVHDIYGECRFGFYQARRMWPQNEPAATGLQKCLEAMAQYYLDQSNLEAARTCIAELAEPNPALEEQARELAQRLNADEEDLQRLKDLERNLDMSTSTLTRSRLAYIFAVIWTSLNVYAVVAYADISYDERLEGYMFSGLRNFSVALIGVLIFRKRIFTNAANRRLIYLLLTIAGTVAFLRWTTWYLQGDLLLSHISDYAIYTVGLILTGLMSDLRICLVALAFASCALMGIFQPEWMPWTATAANFVTFAALGWIWSPKQMEKSVSF